MDTNPTTTELTTRDWNALIACVNAGKTADESGVAPSSIRDAAFAALVEDHKVIGPLWPVAD